MRVPAAVLILLLGSIPVSLSGSPRYFRSNIIGMPLEELSGYRSDEYLYILSIDRESGREIRRLMKTGEEFKRWETVDDGSSVTVSYYLNDTIESVTWEKDGLLVREEFYTDGVLKTAEEYLYEGNELISTLTYDSTGTLVSKRTYRRTAGGKLREVSSQTGEEQESSIYKYGAARTGESLVEEWHGTGGEGNLLRYDDSMISTDEQWGDQSIREITEYEHGEWLITRYQDIDKEIERYIQHDEKGRPVFERWVTAGVLDEEKKYVYEEDLLISVTTRTPGGEDTIRYTYIDGELVKEEHLSGETMVKLRQYDDTGNYFEDIYHRGKPFIRFWYEDGIRVREGKPF